MQGGDQASRVPPAAQALAFPSRGATLRSAALVFFGYLAGAMLGSVLAGPSNVVGVMWPANCALLTALLLSPKGAWWAYALAASLAELIVDFSFYHATPIEGLLSVGANLLETMLAATIITGLAKGRIQFARLSETLLFIVAAGLIGPMAGAAIGAFVEGSASTANMDYWLKLRQWWLGGAIGELTLTPALLTFVAAGAGWRDLLSPGNRRAIASVGVTLATAIGYLVFIEPLTPSQFTIAEAYLILPFLVWIAAQSGVMAATATTAVFAVAVCWMTTRGYPLFGGTALTADVLRVQAFLAVLAATTLMVAALFEERKRAFVSLEERRKLERQLAQSTKLEAIGQLTGGVAHDFNNLLALIGLRLDLAAERLPPGSPSRADIHIAIEGVFRAAKLTEQLLAFARRQPLAPRTADIRPLISRAIELLRRTLGEAIAIEVNLPAMPLICRVDEAQLEAALVNVALNARDAMPRGGKLTVTASVTDHREGLAADGQEQVAAGMYATISVSDTGAGMTPETLKRCFDPFFTTKEVGKGSGLGLSMVQGFAKQSGGYVTASSDPGRGTTFGLHFPISSEQSPVAEPPPLQAARSDGELVLVVEDNEAVRFSAVALLSSLGYRTIEADTAVEALAKLETSPQVAVMFSDIVMPGGVDGIALAAQARKLRPGLKVLLTSGYAGSALNNGPRLPAHREELLTKPYRRADLAARLAMLLGKPPPMQPGAS